MKVKEIIKDTVWMPGARHVAGQKPAVSVLLPTMRAPTAPPIRLLNSCVKMAA
jgi:hypothetical protein